MSSRRQFLKKAAILSSTASVVPFEFLSGKDINTGKITVNNWFIGMNKNLEMYEAYKKELEVNPDIIETDYPADFVGLNVKRKNIYK